MEENVLYLLQDAKKVVLEEVSRGIRFESGIQFEEFVFKTLVAIIKKLNLKSNHLKHSGAQTFPDIIFEHYGIEVKLTKSDSWQSIGNSIKESTKIRGLKKIYLFFLKQGGNPDVRFGIYEDHLNDILVTHSPRYQIDMDIKSNQTIFNKIGCAYKDFTGIKAIRKYIDYCKSQGKDVWWIDPSDPSEKNSKAYLVSFEDLATVEREEFMLDVFILFPEVFSTSNKKFKRASIYLLENYNCLCTNLRDIFTAGGKFTLNKELHDLPHIFGEFFRLANKINNKLMKINLENV